MPTIITSPSNFKFSRVFLKSTKNLSKFQQKHNTSQFLSTKIKPRAVPNLELQKAHIITSIILYYVFNFPLNEFLNLCIVCIKYHAKINNVCRTANTIQTSIIFIYRKLMFCIYNYNRMCVLMSSVKKYHQYFLLNIDGH